MFTAFLMVCLVSACSGGKQADVAEEPEPWKTLSEALTALSLGDYQAYLSYADSAAIAQMDRQTLLLALRQKYSRENYGTDCHFQFSGTRMLSKDSAQVFYTLTQTQGDTIYAVQNMRKREGKWKLVLF